METVPGEFELIYHEEFMARRETGESLVEHEADFIEANEEESATVSVAA